jgi:hypothetical protein
MHYFFNVNQNLNLSSKDYLVRSIFFFFLNLLLQENKWVRANTHVTYLFLLDEGQAQPSLRNHLFQFLNEHIQCRVLWC